MPADEVTPVGSGVGELGISVRFPPFTANTDTKCMPLPSTSRYLPSGDRRASMSAPPPGMAVLPGGGGGPGGRGSPSGLAGDQGGFIMGVKLAFLATLEAREGKGAELGKFLEAGRELAV